MKQFFFIIINIKLQNSYKADMISTEKKITVIDYPIWKEFRDFFYFAFENYTNKYSLRIITFNWPIVCVCVQDGNVFLHCLYVVYLFFSEWVCLAVHIFSHSKVSSAFTQASGRDRVNDLRVQFYLLFMILLYYSFGYWHQYAMHIMGYHCHQS